MSENEIIDRLLYQPYPKLPKLRFSPNKLVEEIAKIARVDDWLFGWRDERIDGITEDDIVKYRGVLESLFYAQGWLNGQAREENLVETGGVRVGRVRWDAKKFALNIAASSKRVDRLDVPKVIQQAVSENDTKFLRRMGKCLNRERAEVDWTRVQNLPCFLVDFWVGHPVHPIPPLCLFSNQALMDFCTLALGTDQGKAAMRKWVSRLRLTRLKPSIITTCRKNPKTLKIEFT